jgi:hypothetical protein
MKKILKGLSLVLMFSILCCSMSVFTSALTVQPLWTNINTMSVSIAFDGTDGIARGIATRQTGVTSMEGTVTLYKYVSSQWVYVNQWSGSSTGYSLIISGSFTGISGVQYKAVFEVTAYSGGSSETATQTAYKTC